MHLSPLGSQDQKLVQLTYMGCSQCNGSCWHSIRTGPVHKRRALRSTHRRTELAIPLPDDVGLGDDLPCTTEKKMQLEARLFDEKVTYENQMSSHDVHVHRCHRFFTPIPDREDSDRPIWFDRFSPWRCRTSCGRSFAVDLGMATGGHCRWCRNCWWMDFVHFGRFTACRLDLHSLSAQILRKVRGEWKTFDRSMQIGSYLVVIGR